VPDVYEAGMMDAYEAGAPEYIVTVLDRKKKLILKG
jgi:predicted flavoprotein YhiN